MRRMSGDTPKGRVEVTYPDEMTGDELKASVAEMVRIFAAADLQTLCEWCGYRVTHPCLTAEHRENCNLS